MIWESSLEKAGGAACIPDRCPLYGCFAMATQHATFLRANYR